MPTNGSSSHVYQYDALDRLTNDDRGKIKTDDSAIESYWNTDSHNWTLDVLGNQTGTDTPAGSVPLATNTPDKANKYSARTVKGGPASVKPYHGDEFNTNTAANWVLPHGNAPYTGAYSGGTTFDVNSSHAGYLTVSAINSGSETIDGEVQPAGQAMLLLGENQGQVTVAMDFTISVFGGNMGGIVFGFKSGKDYWLLVRNFASFNDELYHVTDDPSNPATQNAT
jgi:hypothetical protein